MFQRNAPKWLVNLILIGTGTLRMCSPGHCYTAQPSDPPIPRPKCADLNLSDLAPIQVDYRKTEIQIGLEKPCMVTGTLHARVFTGGTPQQLAMRGLLDDKRSCRFYISRLLKFKPNNNTDLALVFEGPNGDKGWLQQIESKYFDDGEWRLMLEDSDKQDGITKIAEADITAANGGYFGRGCPLVITAPDDLKKPRISSAELLAWIVPAVVMAAARELKSKQNNTYAELQEAVLRPHPDCRPHLKASEDLAPPDQHSPLRTLMADVFHTKRKSQSIEFARLSPCMADPEIWTRQ
jgi:hypothetical protein